MYRWTRRADEIVCLATLLGIESGSILDVPEKDHRGRKIRLLQLLPSLPGSVLFQRPPRLSIHVFRWAPTFFLVSFCNTRRNIKHRSPETFQLGPKEEGLAIKFAGFRIVDASVEIPLQIGGIFPSASTTPLPIYIKPKSIQLQVAHLSPS